MGPQRARNGCSVIGGDRGLHRLLHFARHCGPKLRWRVQRISMALLAYPCVVVAGGTRRPSLLSQSLGPHRGRFGNRRGCPVRNIALAQPLVPSVALPHADLALP